MKNAFRHGGKPTMNIDNIGPATEDLKKALIGKFGSQIRLLMFGSTARGTCDAESDIDLLVLLPFEINPLIEEDVFSIAYEVELRWNVVFGIIVYSTDFWNSERAGVMPLHKNIDREGIAL